ncbi:MAG: class II histone deacetylase [Actinobacteria bacterium]|nr:class II histone deacetylase [Actinomycetota bacterium]
MTATTLTWSDRFGQHDMGDWAIYIPPTGLVEPDLHLDNPKRTARLRLLIAKTGLEERLDTVVPRAATPAEIEAVHSAEHVARMAAVSEAGWGDAGGGFTPMNGDSYELALLSAGSVLTCVERVLGGEADNAYAIGRRSGHHASRDTGYGFCIFNNVAVAAAAAQRAGIERIAIVDVDAHHGNGTEAIFYDDPGVLTISLHEDRMFPLETGAAGDRGGAGAEGANLNIPLPAGTGDGGYLYAFEQLVIPALDRFEPELLLVVAGVDGAMYDPLSNLALTAAGYAAAAEQLLAVAERHCGGRVVFEQEGGYSHVYAPFCWLKLIEVLAAAPRSEDPFADFLGGGFNELAPHQRELVDDLAYATHKENQR